MLILVFYQQRYHSNRLQIQLKYPSRLKSKCRAYWIRSSMLANTRLPDRPVLVIIAEVSIQQIADTT